LPLKIIVLLRHAILIHSLLDYRLECAGQLRSRFISEIVRCCSGCLPVKTRTQLSETLGDHFGVESILQISTGEEPGTLVYQTEGEIDEVEEVSMAFGLFFLVASVQNSSVPHGFQPQLSVAETGSRLRFRHFHSNPTLFSGVISHLRKRVQ
jgi:hypothetical protein